MSDSKAKDAWDKKRKAARKTALWLALIAIGFFAWSIYVVIKSSQGG